MLTEAWLRENVGKRTDAVREVADAHGLSVRISRKGKIVFQMRYRCDGRPRRLDLGVFPEMSLLSARAENARLRGQLRKGIDPKVDQLLEARYVLTDASDTGDLPNVPSRAEELMKILHVVEHSSIARSSKQFLAHCLSAVVSLESSRSRKDQAFEFRPQKARAAVKRTPKQPSRVSDHPRSSN